MGLLPLETLMRAAEGGEREAEMVRADFERAGLDGWLRAAMERRLDPALGARVVPAGASAAVCGALEAFYAFWGRWFPLEYRRVRREWVVLQARWRADACVDPAPAVDPVTSRFFREGLVDVPSMAVSPAAGGFEAGLEPLDAAAGDDGAAGREPNAPEGEPGGEGDGVGGPIPARLPDGTEVLADYGGGLASSSVGDRLDQAVRGSVAAVEEVRAAWMHGSGPWCRWPAPGRWQERSR